jgi:hypothetical protein
MSAMPARHAFLPLLAAFFPSVLAAQFYVAGPPIPELNLAGSSNFSPTVSTDELYMVFASTRAGGSGGYDLYETSRASVVVPWSPPVNIAVLNSINDDYEPNLAIDGLTLLFVSTRAGGIGTSDIYVSTRPTTSSPWGPPANLGGPINVAGNVNDDPYLSENQLTLYYTHTSTSDVWSATRPAIGQPFGAPGPFAPMNSTAFDHSPAVEGNGDLLFFASTRTGGTTGSSDFYMITRDPVTSLYSAPLGIATLNTVDWDSNLSIGRTTGTLFISQFVGINS